jgi:branched-chain amino acid transport system ATP-binding protein
MAQTTAHQVDHITPRVPVRQWERRTSIGRPLTTQPELIILDEATEGLAQLIVAEIWRVIGETRKDGTATLIVDHDYPPVLALSDRRGAAKRAGGAGG